MKKIIIGLTGKMSSGKGTVAQYLKKEHTASIYRFSTPLRDVLDRIHIDQTRDNMQNLSFDLRKRFGDDILASIIAADVKNDDHSLIIIDGVRRLPDIKYLRELPEFKLISIETEQKTRWQRMTMRGENPDDVQKTFEQFQEDEKNEAERQIDEVAQTADYKIDNNGSYEDLFKRVGEILAELNEN